MLSTCNSKNVQSASLSMKSMKKEEKKSSSIGSFFSDLLSKISSPAPQETDSSVQRGKAAPKNISPDFKASYKSGMQCEMMSDAMDGCADSSNDELEVEAIMREAMESSDSRAKKSKSRRKNKKG